MWCEMELQGIRQNFEHVDPQGPAKDVSSNADVIVFWQLQNLVNKILLLVNQTAQCHVPEDRNFVVTNVRNSVVTIPYIYFETSLSTCYLKSLYHTDSNVQCNKLVKAWNHNICAVSNCHCAIHPSPHHLLDMRPTEQEILQIVLNSETTLSIYIRV